MKKSLWQKQIPTILGITVLVVALIVGVGVFTFQQGPAVFAPRATPQTTPKKVKITNVTDTSFTVSFFTDDKIAGFVKYGTEADSLKSQASDDRDQLAGSVGSYNVHHITVRGLQPNTPYHYVLGTGNRDVFDNQGTAFTLTTAKRSGAPSAAKTAYGNVLDTTGGPAEGAVVYVSLEGVGEQSSLVKNSGSWAVPLSNARTSDGGSYAQITDEQNMTITVQGNQADKTATMTTTVSASQPVPSITLGGSGVPVAQASPSASPDSTEPVFEEETTATPSASPVNMLASLLDASSSATATPSTVVDLTKTTTTPVTVTTTQPVIKGEAKPNVKVKIEVHSDTAITQTVTADNFGDYELDIEKLSEVLEPGEHTVTVTYTDPDTGELVTEERTFYIAQAAATGASPSPSPSPSVSPRVSPSPSASTGPYGTGSPYPFGTSPSPTSTASASMSGKTKGGTESARTSLPSTSSAIPVSGSVGTTFILILGGLFFLVAGGWSFWISYSLREDEA